MNAFTGASAVGLTIAAALCSLTPAWAAPTCGLAPGQKATGEPIQLGAVVSATGLDDFSSSAKAASAYFKCVNENGGIHGRPVQYTVIDDQWRPDVSAQAAASLVKDKHVLALVGDMSIPGCGANAALYVAEGVVDVPAVGVVRECFNSPNIAPINAGPRLSAIGISRFAVEQLGVNTMVCLTPKIPGAADWICGGLEKWAQGRNAKVTTITFDPVSPDMTSVILQSAASHPDAVVLTFSKGTVVAALAAAEQQGLGDKIKFLGLASSYALDLPEAIGPYWKNKYRVNLEFSPLDSSGPDVQNWKAVMDSFGKPSDPRDNFSEAGYIAARVATQALLSVDPANLSRATVTAALRQVKNFKSDILCRPWYFGDGPRHNANHSGLTAQVSDGEWKIVSDCIDADDPELADIFAVEKAGK